MRGLRWLLMVSCLPAATRANEVDPATTNGDWVAWGDAAKSSDRAGEAVRVADLDGDGVRDLIVAEPYWDDGNGARGRLGIFFGPQGLPGEHDLRAEVPDSFLRLVPADGGITYARRSITVADLDGDGVTDLLVGVEVRPTDNRKRFLWTSRLAKLLGKISDLDDLFGPNARDCGNFSWPEQVVSTVDS